jgi:hypothetical protein
MSERVTVEIVDRGGTSHAVFGVGDAAQSGLLAAVFTDSIRDAADGGSGMFMVPSDHPSAGQIVPERIARFRVDGSTVAAIEIATVDRDLAGPAEHAGRLDVVAGETLGILLGTSEVGGSVVWPPCGEIGGFTGDIRNFGWMDCCCFDHATRFTGTLFSYGQQRNPAVPFSKNEPDRWPDRSAHRLWFEAPTTITAGRNEIQSIKLGDAIQSGFFTITFRGQTTGNITSPWSAANVEAALEALSNVDSVSVSGAGLNNNPYLVEFDGASFQDQTQPLMSVGHLFLDHPPPPLPQAGQKAIIAREQTARPGVYRSDPACAYFYRSFTTVADLDLVLFVSANETADVYIDGTRVYRQRSATDMGTETLHLPAGDHCITARVCKESGENTVGWFMATLAVAAQQQDGGWEIGSVVVRTNTAGWLVHSTGVNDPAPGVTAGEILICLLEEGDAQGDLDDITWDFDEQQDSNGDAWGSEYVWGEKIGTGMLDVVHRVTDLFDGTFHMDPVTLVLSVYQTQGIDRTGTVVFTEPAEGDLATYGGGIVQESASRTRKRASRLLIETGDGFSSAVDVGIPAPNRRIGVTMGTADTIEGLAGFALSMFAQVGRETFTDALSTEGPSGLEPYTDFQLGDAVTVPGFDGTGMAVRVMGLQLQMDGDGHPIWTLLVEEVPGT